MRIKMRHITSGGFIKSENYVEIKDVMINEHFLHPEDETIAIGFRNKGYSGIIEFKAEEFEKLANSVKRKVHLLKGVKIFNSGTMVKVRKSD